MWGTAAALQGDSAVETAEKRWGRTAPAVRFVGGQGARGGVRGGPGPDRWGQVRRVRSEDRDPGLSVKTLRCGVREKRLGTEFGPLGVRGDCLQWGRGA